MCFIGACVTFVTLITTTLITIVSIVVWKWNIIFSILFFLIFGFIDGAYLSATLLKVPQGAWATIVIAAVIALFMIIWHTGKLMQWKYEEPRAMDLPDLIKANVLHHDGGMESVVLSRAKTGERLVSLKGLSIIFDSAGFGIPPVYSHFTDAFAASPDIAIFLHIRNLPQPTVS
jgi:KUP system potassium uptake protein